MHRARCVAREKAAGRQRGIVTRAALEVLQKIPGLRHYEISRGPVGTPSGPSGVHLVATLTFDNAAAIQAAFGTPEGQAAAADVGKFATGGVDMLIFETEEA
jgi:uncharacterized protein (TIGR02118 family)